MLRQRPMKFCAPNPEVLSDQLLPCPKSESSIAPDPAQFNHATGFRILQHKGDCHLGSTLYHHNWSNILRSKSVSISFITHLFEKSWGPKVSSKKAFLLYFCLQEAGFYLLFKRNMKSKYAWLIKMRGGSSHGT